VDKNVGELQISVDNLKRPNVSDAFDDLIDDDTGFCLRDAPARFQ